AAESAEPRLRRPPGRCPAPREACAASRTSAAPLRGADGAAEGPASDGAGADGAGAAGAESAGAGTVAAVPHEAAARAEAESASAGAGGASLAEGAPPPGP